jgi:hypothetical protein
MKLHHEKHWACNTRAIFLSNMTADMALDCWWSYSRMMLSLWRLPKHKQTNDDRISWIHSDHLGTRRPWLDFLYRISSLRHHVRIDASGPPNLPSEHRGLFPTSNSGRRVKPTIHLYLVTRSRMLEALILSRLHVFMEFWKKNLGLCKFQATCLPKLCPILR